MIHALKTERRGLHQSRQGFLEEMACWLILKEEWLG